MKPVVKYAAIGAGAIALLFGSFVTFSALSGQPLHKIAILKNFVKAPDEPAEPDTNEHGGDTAEHDPQTQGHGSETEPAAEPHEQPKLASKEDLKALEKSVGVLGAFTLPSPFSSDELTDIQQAMKSKNRNLDTRETKVAQRERELDDREHDLDERQQELSALRKRLADKESELQMLSAEVERDSAARNARDAASWKEISKFFEEGDPKDMAGKLLAFAPAEAAKILRSLDDERASALVNALPEQNYRDYIEAYRSLSSRDTGKKNP
ncbi:MAG: hypothetical protein IPJ19_05655 [Planctomycetes bacterium]|nr:hypothetical protein [Planctomycetota bacterium]